MYLLIDFKIVFLYIFCNQIFLAMILLGNELKICKNAKFLLVSPKILFLIYICVTLLIYNSRRFITRLHINC